jgi:hypothetical protein
VRPAWAKPWARHTGETELLQRQSCQDSSLACFAQKLLVLCCTDSPWAHCAEGPLRALWAMVRSVLTGQHQLNVRLQNKPHLLRATSSSARIWFMLLQYPTAGLWTEYAASTRLSAACPSGSCSHGWLAKVCGTSCRIAQHAAHDTSSQSCVVGYCDSLPCHKWSYHNRIMLHLGQHDTCTHRQLLHGWCAV